jgi:Zn-dependent protease with chaperone function
VSILPRKVLKNLESTEYEHSDDKKALDVLKKTPGLDFVVKKFYELGLERVYRINYTGSHIKVSKDNFPELLDLFTEACKILDLSSVPDFYLELNPLINGFTTGVDNPIVVLTTGTIDSLADDELMYIIGHELGHIKSGHVLYHTMAQIFPIIGDMLGTVTLGIGNMLSSGVQLALLNWARKSELTADRAGLLASQNHNGVVGSLMKIAGVPRRYYGKVSLNSFVKQAKEFKDLDFDNLDKIAKVLSVMDNTHPWTVMRASEILDWVEKGEYRRIVNNH